MNKIIPIISLSLLSLSAQADPTAYVGMTYAFGTSSPSHPSSGFGLTAKVISDNIEKQAVAAVGVTYYPLSAQKYGFDVSAGYILEVGAGFTSDPVLLVGWDFMKKSVHVSVGWADTDKEDESPTPTVTPPAPVVPTTPTDPTDLR